MRSPLLTLALLALAASLLAAGCGGGTSASPTSMAALPDTPATTATVSARAASPPTTTIAASATPSPLVTVPPLWFVDATHGWTAAERGVLATEDGGYTWTARGSPGGNVFWLDFTSADNGWAATDVGLFRTGDSGATWHAIATGAEGTPTWVQFVDDETGWVLMIAPQPATGPRPGQLLRTASAGAAWGAVTVPPRCSGLSGLFAFTGVTDGYAVCSREGAAGFQAKALYRTVDGGEEWEQVAEAGWPAPATPVVNSLPLSGYPQDVFFLSQQMGWIAADRAGLIVTRDGGVTWQYLRPADVMPRVIFVSPQRGWILERAPTPSSRFTPDLFGTTDGGQTWQQLCVGDFLACGR